MVICPPEIPTLYGRLKEVESKEGAIRRSLYTVHRVGGGTHIQRGTESPATVQLNSLSQFFLKLHTEHYTNIIN